MHWGCIIFQQEIKILVLWLVNCGSWTPKVTRSTWILWLVDPIRATNEAITYNTVTTSTLQKSNRCEKRKNTLPIRPQPHQAFPKESVFVSNKRKENIFCHTSVLFSSLLRTITCFYLQTRTFRCTCDYPQH